ncbi:MAG TPA: ATP-binding protein [Dokdonella sp.]|uniref:sensor histidine kinase n=1 Tax=Dokdonella sp. TaxID=2291710 RepID=UPI002B913901|nr:ATP-binding protein [Dokdonella sp.]HUD40900.1 ATP-binding protein [Dokdonella sp.]
MLPRSLTSRLMLASLAAVLAAALGAVAILLLLWPGSPEAVLRAELLEEVEQIEDGLRTGPDGGLLVGLDYENLSIYDAMPKDAAYQVRDAAGTVVAHSIDGPAQDLLDRMDAAEGEASLPNGAETLRLRLIERGIVHEGRRYAVRVARSERLVVTLRHYAGKLYLRAGLVTVALALVMFTLVVYLTICRMLRPLREASEVARRLEPRKLSMRLSTAGLPAEIVPLIDALNAALARLEAGFRVQQQFLASAAHELKTPLALLQAEIELGGAADTPTLLRDTAQMGRIVHQLLHLAEASEGHNYRFETLDLRVEMEEAIDYLQRLAEPNDVGLQLEVDADRAVCVEADRGALFVLAKNLLENAIHHSPRGAAIRVRVGAEGFSVEDAGRGVAAPDVPFLFERFWRARTEDSGGAGLGLAICREICQAHRWRIDYAGTSAAGGARFAVLTRPEPAA